MKTKKHFELKVHENTTYIEILGMLLKSTQGKWVAFNIYMRKNPYKLIS